MKIIYIATSVIPAHKANAKQVMKMGQAFVQQGVEVELIIPVRFGGVRLKVDPFDYYGIAERFKITKIFSIDLIPWEKYLSHLGFWLQNISFAILTALYLLFKKYDFIYSRDRFTLFLLSFFTKKLIWEEHNWPKKISWFQKRLLKQIDKIIVISHSLKADFLAAGVKESKILVAPDSVDLKEFQVEISSMACRQKLNLPLNKRLVIYTGHLFAWKGVYTLAASARFLSADTEIILVGGMKDDLEKFKKFIETEKIDKIKILGYQSPLFIPYYLNAADVLVLPNSAQEDISRKYTSPLKLFEYMAASKPIVASDLPAIREILTEQEAVLVKPGRPESLADGIKKVLADNNLAAALSRQGRQLAEQYTWQNRAKTILEFITS